MSSSRAAMLIKYRSLIAICATVSGCSAPQCLAFGREPCVDPNVGLDTRRVKPPTPLNGRSSSPTSSPSASSSCSKACSAPTTRSSWRCWSSGCRASSRRRRCATASSAPSRSGPSPPLLAAHLIRVGWVKLARRRLPALPDVPALPAGRRAEAAQPAEACAALAGADRVLGHGRQSRARQHRVLRRLDSGRRGDVARRSGWS